MNIFIIGPMGSGKSTIGKLLAAELGLEFLDTDQEIEKNAGVEISWIFDIEGEDGFRSREEAVISDLVKRNGVLVATGGGAVLSEKNRNNLASRGTVLYLETPAEIQFERTRHDQKRPLLNEVDDRLLVLKELNEMRDPLYREIADYVINTGKYGTKNTLRSVLACLESDEENTNRR